MSFIMQYIIHQIGRFFKIMSYSSEHCRPTLLLCKLSCFHSTSAKQDELENAQMLDSDEDELLAAWNDAQQSRVIRKIKPLE